MLKKISSRFEAGTTLMSGWLLPMMLFPVAILGQRDVAQPDVIGSLEAASESFPNVRTVGGITYLRYQVWIPTCTRLRIESTPQLGNYSWPSFTCEGIPGCVSIPESRGVLVTGTFVFGAMPAGSYTLMVPTAFAGYGIPNETSVIVLMDVPAEITPTLLALPKPDTSPFAGTVNGVPGVKYSVQASTNMMDWTSISTNLGGPFQFSDSGATNLSSRFYRVFLEAAEPLSETIPINLIPVPGF